jgi:hypothetical protein
VIKGRLVFLHVVTPALALIDTAFGSMNACCAPFSSSDVAQKEAVLYAWPFRGLVRRALFPALSNPNDTRVLHVTLRTDH